MRIQSITDISLDGGLTRLSQFAAARCYGGAVAVLVWDDETPEERAQVAGRFRLDLPPEAKTINRAVLLAQIEARLGTFADGDDLGMTQDCYATEMPASVYGAARSAAQIYRDLRGN